MGRVMEARRIMRKSERVGQLKNEVRALKHTIEEHEREIDCYRAAPFSGASAYYRYENGKVDIPGETLANAIFLNYNVLLKNKEDVAVAKTWNDVALLPQVVGGMKLLTDTDYVLIALVEAPQVGRGEVSFRELDQILIDLYGKFYFGRNRQKGLQPLDAWYICPHAPFVECACSRPLPGLIFRAAVEMDICLAQSWLIGKHGYEIKAGISAGVENLIYIMSGQEWKADSIEFPNKCDTDSIEVPVCRDMLQAAQMITKER